LLIVIPTVLPGLSSQSWKDSAVPAAGESGGLLIAEVCPARPVEYVIIRNCGGDVNLNGTAISDGEGTLSWTAHFVLASLAEVAIAADASTFAKVHPGIACLEFTSPQIRKAGRFALADTGDEVQLLDGSGALIDMLAYGKSAYSGPGWSGAPALKGGSADALVRGGPDTNSSLDWSPAPPGRSALMPAEFPAVVEPFAMPENAAERLVREIQTASVWVKAAVYELTDPVVVNAFAACAGRGVNVSVLVEGQPVGGMSADSRAAATALLDAGCDVRALRSQDAYKRYDYLHCKYLIADGLRSVVMSENWGSGLWNNRGWGVCAQSYGLVEYLEGMFDADFSGQIDVSANIEPAPYSGQGATAPGPVSELVRWRAAVIPIVSPDFSEEALRGMIASARDRILVQQMYCQENWLASPGLLTDLIDAASRGVTVRLLLDNTFSKDENFKVAEAINALAARTSVDMQAKVVSSYHGISIMHNKGMIMDDSVLISSINWGDSALRDNRELGLLVRSSEISGFFSDLFWADWADDPLPPTMRLGHERILTYAGMPVLLDGSNITDRSGISLIAWDLDGDGRPDGTGAKFVAVFEEGVHVVTVTAYDRYNNSAQGTVTVTAMPLPGQQGEDRGGLPYLAVLPLVPVAAFIVFKRIKERKGH